MFLLLNKMMSPADILSVQAAASLQRDSLKYDLVGSPSKRDDIGTVYPAYSAQQSYKNIMQYTKIFFTFSEYL